MNIKVSKMQGISPGDKVRTKRYGTFPVGLVGYVSRVVEGFDDEDHGTVEVKITGLRGEARKYFTWLKVGDKEHWCYTNWQDSLEIV